MKEIEYLKMAAFEDAMWWFRGLRSNLLALVERFGGERGSLFLDAGCGTGGFLRALQQHRPADTLFGVDIYPGAVEAARGRTDARLMVASVNELPFRDNCFRCIASADVISHVAVDSAGAIAENFRCLAPGGYLIVQAPAYMWLFGYHDVQVQTARRFTRRELEKLLSDEGFEPCFGTYWNTLLFPLLAIRRKFLPHGRQSDVMAYPPLLDAFFGSLVLLESRLIRHGVRLPFGSSVLVVARKPAKPS